MKNSFLQAKTSLIRKVKDRGNLAYISVEQQLDLIQGLCEFEMGKFLIEQRKFNAYYIHYINTYPLRNSNSNSDINQNPLSSLENFILNRSPTSLATQERYRISQNIIKKHFYNGCAFSSIPCGVMGEFLELDLSSYSDFCCYGIDIDEETLTPEKEYCKKTLNKHYKFYQKDAWNLNINEKFNFIMTDGLTIYESSDSRVVDLYREFYKALQPNGLLLTSFLTPPPKLNDPGEWKIDQINQEDLLLEKIIALDILNCKWTNFRSTNMVKDQLQQCGFTIMKVFYDRNHMMPIIMAKK